MSPDDLLALEDTLETLLDPKAIRAIRKAGAEIDEGRFLTAEDLRGKYLKLRAKNAYTSQMSSRSTMELLWMVETVVSAVKVACIGSGASLAWGGGHVA